jgi:hypothetical protein
MAQGAAKSKRVSAGIAARTDVHDPLAEFLVYMQVILPEAAIHTVTIRRYVDPAKKTRWVVCPGTFHVRRGDLIYWSSPQTAVRIEFDTASLIGIPSLEVPCGGTSMGSIQSAAPSGTHRYRVLVGATPAVGDDGSDPTIIVDD